MKRRVVSEMLYKLWNTIDLKLFSNLSLEDYEIFSIILRINIFDNLFSKCFEVFDDLKFLRHSEGINFREIINYSGQNFR